MTENELKGDNKTVLYCTVRAVLKIVISLRHSSREVNKQNQ